MYNCYYFIKGYDLPYILSENEVYFLLNEIKQGNEQARAKLIEHNIRLVLYEVLGRFKTVAYDKNDLISVGTMGLIKAVETFNIDKGVQFSTYAIKCIDNEIFTFIKNLSTEKKIAIESFEMPVSYEQDESDLKLIDIIDVGIDIEKEYINNEIYSFIRQSIAKLPERDKKIIMMYFGFFDDIVYTQTEIAENLSISQARVSKIIIKNIEKISRWLQQNNLIEVKGKYKKIHETKNKVKVLK